MRLGLRQSKRSLRIWRRIRTEAERLAPADRAICAALTQPQMETAGRSRWRRGTYGQPGGTRLFRFRLKGPRGNSTAEDGTFPLLIFLHGADRNGTDGKASLAHAFLLRCHLRIFCREKFYVLIPQLAYGANYDTDEFSDALGAVIERIPQVDRRRIYLTGISQGGGGTFSECVRHPERYAAGPSEAPWLEALLARGAEVRYTFGKAFGHKMTG
ncbi:MAG: hypothetical protein LBJ11_10750, partial [Oscillospiraceae bacterium]|nr:hypothetical protein [Oscillospiraceae bacterium]